MNTSPQSEIASTAQKSSLQRQTQVGTPRAHDDFVSVADRSSSPSISSPLLPCPHAHLSILSDIRFTFLPNPAFPLPLFSPSPLHPITSCPTLPFSDSPILRSIFEPPPRGCSDRSCFSRCRHLRQHRFPAPGLRGTRGPLPRPRVTRQASCRFESEL